MNVYVKREEGGREGGIIEKKRRGRGRETGRDRYINSVNIFCQTIPERPYYYHNIM